MSLTIGKLHENESNLESNEEDLNGNRLKGKESAAVSQKEEAPQKQKKTDESDPSGDEEQQ